MLIGGEPLWDLRLEEDAIDRAYLGEDIVWPMDNWPLTRPATLAWWRSDFYSTLDLVGGKVSEWRDCVGQRAAVQATDVDRPVYSETSFANTPGVLFNGGWLELASSPWPINADNGMMIVVCDQLALPAEAGPDVLAAYGATAVGQRKVTRSVQAGVNRGGFEIGNGFTTDLFEQARVDFSGRHSVICYFGDVSSTASLDDSVFSGTSTLALRTTDGRTRIGADADTTPTEFCNAIIRDVLIISGALLSGTDFLDFQTWAYGRALT